MPLLLNDLPFAEHNTRLLREDGQPFLGEQGQPLLIFHDQIVFWGSLAPRNAALLPPDTARFPIVLDTGFNDTFLISESQLRDWAGLDPAALPLFGTDLRISGQVTLSKRMADLWVYPNHPGERDRLAGMPAVRIELPDGIAVWPAHVPGAKRLPLFGLRAVHVAGLHLTIDGRKRLVRLERPETTSAASAAE